MRRLVLVTLLVTMPFSGMRVICIDSPTDISCASARTETETGADCVRMCPPHEPSGTPPVAEGNPDPPQNSSDCALSADASYVSSIVAGVAIARPHEPLHVTMVASAVHARSPRFGLEPDLAPLAPPPKLRAL
jgi:hypothetical protein